MTNEQSQPVIEIFDAALALAPAERDAYLAAACASDESLRSQVERLLVRHEQAEAEGFLARPAQPDLDQKTLRLAGRRVGPYLLQHELGSGGMGVVYLAVRADDVYWKEVAVKLVWPALQRAGVLRRFDQERQILAQLDHPNIARVKEQADLTVTKSSSKLEVCPDDPLTYTIGITNNGPNKAPGVVLTDTLPANVIIDPLPPGCVHSGNTVTCDIGALEVKATATLKLTVRPTAEAAGVPITNCASVRGDVCGDDPGNNQVCVSTPVRRKADLMVALSASAPEVCVNDPITYTAGVTNKGPNTASDVALRVTLPANVSIDAPLPTGCVDSGNLITCNIGEMNANAPRATFDFKVKPLPGAGREIRVGAKVTGNICDPAIDNNETEVVTKVRPLVDLVVTKTGPIDPVCAGGEITYTINYSNNGPNAAPNAKLIDEIPANTVFRSITPPPGSGFTCSGPPVDGTGTVICTNPSMAANTTVSFTLVARILPSTPDGAEITNTATVTSDACEKDLAKNKAMVKTGMVRRVDLSITKTGIVDPASPNMINPRLIYTITVSNKGGCSEAKNVELIDQILDQNYQYVHLLPNLTEGAKCTQYPTGKRQVVCVLAGTIAPGDPPRTIKLVFETTSKTEKPTICNEVSIRSDTPDSNPEDDYDNFRIDVGGGRPRICRFPTDKRAASK